MPELIRTIRMNDTNLKFYGRFESGAETTDSSGTGNTLSAIGVPTYSAGKFGQGVDLVTDKAFSITDGATVKPTGNFTVNVWLKNSTGTNLTFFQSYSQNTNVAGIWIRIGTNTVNAFIGKNTGTSNGTDYKTVTGTIAVNDGGWHMVTLTWDGSNYRLFIDAKFDVAVASTFGAAYAATNYVRVGCGNTTGTNIDFFNGSLDDVFLLNGTALSADQIKELYEGRYVGEGWPQAGLVAGYHLSDVTDFSGNNYHLTNNGTTTFPQGKFNLSADLGTSNTTKYLRVATNAGIDGGIITMSCWAKLRTEIGSGKYKLIYQSSATSKVGYSLIYDYNSGTRQLQFSREKIGVSENGPTYTVTLGTSLWYHLVLVYDNTNIAGYVNGNSIGSTATSGNGTYVSTGNNICIGAYYPDLANLGNLSSAIIDEVQIYNIAKDARWVRQQFAWGSGKFL